MTELEQLEKDYTELQQSLADAEAFIEELKRDLDKATDDRYEAERRYDHSENENIDLQERIDALEQCETLMEVFANPNNWDGNKFTPQETKWQIDEPYRFATDALEGHLK